MSALPVPAGAVPAVMAVHAATAVLTVEAGAVG